MIITIACVGKVKEKFYREAIQEYVKRLSAYCRLEFIVRTFAQGFMQSQRTANDKHNMAGTSLITSRTISKGGVLRKARDLSYIPITLTNLLSRFHIVKHFFASFLLFQSDFFPETECFFYYKGIFCSLPYPKR